MTVAAQKVRLLSDGCSISYLDATEEPHFLSSKLTTDYDSPGTDQLKQFIGKPQVSQLYIDVLTLPYITWEKKAYYCMVYRSNLISASMLIVLIRMIEGRNE